MAISWTRLLVILLALRAVLAPLSYHPTNPDPSHRHRHSLGMSIRWWPAQRLQRFSGSSKLLQLYQGKNRPVSDDEVIHAAWPRSRHRPDFAIAALSPRPLDVPRTTLLRC